MSHSQKHDDGHGHDKKHKHGEHGHNGHGHHVEMPPKLTPQEMRQHEIPLLFRDECAAALIPLNQCRKENFGLPWKCNEPKTHYKHCMHAIWEQRAISAQQKKLQELKIGSGFNGF